MARKTDATDGTVGMFVADLAGRWVDTPLLVQGFLVENQQQILALKTHCEYVIVDRARSTGDQFEAPAAAAIAVAREPAAPARHADASTPAANADDVTQVTPPQAVETKSSSRAPHDAPARIT